MSDQPPVVIDVGETQDAAGQNEAEETAEVLEIVPLMRYELCNLFS